MNRTFASLAGVRASVRAPVVLRSGLLLAAVGTLVLAAARPTFAADAPTPAPSADRPPDAAVPPNTPPPIARDLDTLTTRGALGRDFARGGPTHGVEQGPGRDTTKVLPWGAQLWGEGGIGGMIAPSEVKEVFSVGLGGQLVFRIEHAHRLETHARLELQALPRSAQIQAVDQYGYAQQIPLGGNGLRYAATVGSGVRLWHRLWAEGGIGFASLQVPAGNEALNDLIEPAAVTAIRNTTGFAVDAQLAWRFPITDTQNMSVTLGWQGNKAGDSGRWLHYLPFRIGWQFL